VVVLLDLKMPKVTGAEVLREVKSNEQLKCIPVVMLTSSREAQDLRECYRLGANGYVVKPVDAKHFTQVITNIGAYWAATNEPPPCSQGRLSLFRANKSVEVTKLTPLGDNEVAVLVN